MRCSLLQLCMVSLFCIPALGVEIQDLAGTWDVTAKGEMEEGVEMETLEQVVYQQNGGILSQGGAFLFTKDKRVRLMTVGVEDRGVFRIEDGKIHVKTEKMEVDFFASSMPDMSRKVFDESLEEMMKDEEIYTVVSVEKDRIVLKDEEDGMESVMIRHVNKPKPLHEDPTRRKGVDEDVLGKRHRFFSMALLEFDGFSASKWLPTWRERSGVAGELRKKEEILNRLMCSYAAVVWATTPEENLLSERLKSLIEERGLKEHFTEKEREVLGTERKEAVEKFQSSVGWQIENMWALAWVLGFDEVPDIDQNQVGQETIAALFQFLAPSWADKDAFLKKLEARNLNEVVQLEDIFYCAHNAVRSAQTGKENCVPEGFHPVRHGGIIHEKRHALTWVLSPGVDWEDTDLST